uniref:Uncharacterized protein n=1 Tax=Panagrolaimus sp. JU765 TaxID=591449 RepID=A0AC34QR68_9BILA
MKPDKRHVDAGGVQSKQVAQKEVCNYTKPSTEETQKTSEIAPVSEGCQTAKQPSKMKEPQIPTETTARESSSSKKEIVALETVSKQQVSDKRKTVFQTVEETLSKKEKAKTAATTFVSDYDKDRAKTPNVPLPPDWNEKLKKIIDGVDLRDPPTANLPDNRDGEVSIEKNLETLKSGIQTQKEVLEVEGTQEATAEHDKKLTVEQKTEEVAH